MLWVSAGAAHGGRIAKGRMYIATYIIIYISMNAQRILHIKVHTTLHIAIYI